MKQQATRTGFQIADDLTLPIDAVTQKLAWIGRTGSGKSYAAQKLAEQMLEVGAQVIVLDPTGQWSSLRLGPHAFPIPVFGGLRGDVPLDPRAGGVVADLVVTRQISAVLDVSQMDDEDLWLFSSTFAARFFKAKKAAPSAVHLFVDECQEFVPQNVVKAAQEAVRVAFARLQYRGRVLGIGTSLISLRPQAVDKAVLNLAACLFAFQTTGPHERKAIASWMATKGLSKNLVETLPSLKAGESHVWAPEWLGTSKVVRIRPKQTPDVSRTPVVGDLPEATRVLSPLDLRDLRVTMETAFERAHHDDPALLRARIVDLETQLRAKRGRAKVGEAAVLPAPKPVFVPVLSDDDRELLERVAAEGRALGARVDALLSRVSAAPEPQRESPARVSADRERVETATPARAGAAERRGEPKNSPASRERRTARVANGKLGGGERKVLTVLAQYPGQRNRRQIAILSGYAKGGGAFKNYLSALRTRGLIAGRETISISAAGLEELGPFERLPTGAALREYWLQQLGKAERLILDAVCEAYPEALTKDEVAAASGYDANGGGFKNALSRLRTLELVQGRGEIAAAAELF